MLEFLNQNCQCQKAWKRDMATSAKRKCCQGGTVVRAATCEIMLHRQDGHFTTSVRRRVKDGQGKRTGVIQKL